MNIPLKAEPKVSTINILDDSKFQLDDDKGTTPKQSISNTTDNSSGTYETDHSIESYQPGSSNRLDQTSSFGSHLLKLRQKIDPNQRQESLPPPTKEITNYRALRRYSETEKNNFDETTGHRLYDDGKIRPQVPRTENPNHDFNRFNTFTSLNKVNEDSNQTSNRTSRAQSPTKIYSRSHDELIDTGDADYVVGLEDEYIPGLDFADLIYRWNKNVSDQNLIENASSNQYDIKNENLIHSNTTSHTSTPQSREASYLDLNQLHAKVAPQPIRSNQSNPGKFSYSKLHDFMKSRGTTAGGTVSNNSHSNSNSTTGLNIINEGALTIPSNIEIKPKKPGHNHNNNGEDDHKPKRQKSDLPDEINYEWILNSLPQNFNDLPYSQRKKLVRSFSESIDYSQFSLFAKNYLNDKFGSSNSSGKTNRSGGNGGGINSGNNSFVRRSRMGSVSTVAERLLARTSTNDLKQLDSKVPRVNVDEKGAIVMNHELGKIIGFGAFGVIRECVDNFGTVRAIKIVKSTRDMDSSPSRTSSPSRADLRKNKPNAKVLEVFKKEIAIWKQLHHENILPLLKYLETEHAIFCITNRIYGGTLFELVSSWGLYSGGIMNTTGPLEFSIEGQMDRLMKVIRCTAQIVKALLYMHEMKGIVHGDMKLENVLVESEEKDGEYKMILCDFGMSRVYTSRLSRKSSARYLPNPISPLLVDEETLMMRSRSSNTETRKPYQGGDSASTRNLKVQDDSRLGISQLFKSLGPSLQSVDLTPTHSGLFNSKLEVRPINNSNEGIDSELPHSHIGSLPYASPELLSPSPPPLGPSADVWALGVLIYTMCVGKLPFQHQYEPRLRAMITAGKYNKDDLKKACLLEWIFKEKTDDDSKSDNNKDVLPASLMIQSPSLIDLKRQQELQVLQKAWLEYKDTREFEWLYNIITGCLEKDITKRWDMEMIYESFCRNSGEIERMSTA
ncbi:Ca2+/calmodulin-dependent protein kinase [Scheffersomyces coipomensis]|uniref:Ca2+/calmodulin-dependent protein kinase n=1 Tax=Scheffersomyces coipomensis TaxID=1788519 RepID=UPI00315D8823